MISFIIQNILIQSKMLEIINWYLQKVTVKVKLL